MRKLATFVALSMLAPAAWAEEPYMCVSTDIDGNFPKARGDEIRFATFNSFLNRFAPNGLINDLGNPANPQIRAVAEITRHRRLQSGGARQPARGLRAAVETRPRADLWGRVLADVDRRDVPARRQRLPCRLVGPPLGLARHQSQAARLVRRVALRHRTCGIRTSGAAWLRATAGGRAQRNV